MEMNAHGSCWAWQLEGGMGNLSLASSTRRPHRWGGRQGCLRPSSRALRDDPSKPSIKVRAGGSTEMEERFHFPGTLYFDVNRHGCGTVAGSARDGSFFLAVGMFLLKYGGNILPGEPGTQLAQKGENLRGKKNRCRAANKLPMKRENRQREQLARAQQRKLSAWETFFLCYIISKAKEPLKFKEGRNWKAKVTLLTGNLIFIT